MNAREPVKDASHELLEARVVELEDQVRALRDERDELRGRMLAMREAARTFIDAALHRDPPPKGDEGAVNVPGLGDVPVSS